MSIYNVIPAGGGGGNWRFVLAMELLLLVAVNETIVDDGSMSREWIDIALTFDEACCSDDVGNMVVMVVVELYAKV